MKVEYTNLSHNGRVFTYSISGVMDFSELNRLTLQWQKEVLDPAPMPVYYITDFSGITKIPPTSVSSALQLARRASPNLAYNMVVTKNTFIRRISSILSGLVKSFKLQVYPTVEEALAEVERLLAEENKKSGNAQTK